VAIGIAIAAMALNSFNAYRITELNNEVSALKPKPDLLTSITWRKRPMRRIKYWLTSLNQRLLYHKNHRRCRIEISIRGASP
jgi:hypothetical protein